VIVFGPRRALFGSDWPVCLLAASYDRVVRTARELLDGLSDADAAAQAPELVAKLGDKVQIPRGLGAIGMKREQIAEMAELSTSVKRLLDNSPVSFDKEALIGILEEAF